MSYSRNSHASFSEQVLKVLADPTNFCLKNAPKQYDKAQTYLDYGKDLAIAEAVAPVKATHSYSHRCYANKVKLSSSSSQSSFFIYEITLNGNLPSIPPCSLVQLTIGSSSRKDAKDESQGEMVFFEGSNKDKNTIKIHTLFKFDSSLAQLPLNFTLYKTLTSLQRLYDAAAQVHPKKQPFFKSLLKGESYYKKRMEPPVDYKSELTDKLNDSQKQALNDFKEMEEGQLVIVGPPGTGKTTTIVSLIQAARANYPAEQVIVCAPSNAAVQVLVTRFLKHNYTDEKIAFVPSTQKIDSLNKNLKELTAEHEVKEEEAYLNTLIQFINTYPTQKENIKNRISLLEFLDENTIEELEDQADSGDNATLIARLENIQMNLSDNKRLIKEIKSHSTQNAGVIFVTQAMIPTIDVANVGTVISDENSQSVEQESTLLVLAKVPQLKRWVVVGDPYQLPPLLQSEQAKAAGYGISLIERLTKYLSYQSSRWLLIQYRNAFMNFSNKHFYSNRIKTAQLLLDNPTLHLTPQEKEHALFAQHQSMFIDVPGEEIAMGTSYYNIAEAKAIVHTVKVLKQQLNVDLEKDVMILTPYSAQRTYLSGELKREGLNAKVKTVDESQGDEVRINLISLVRNNDESITGFIKDVKRLNVALTRAIAAQFVFGNKATFFPVKLSDPLIYDENILAKMVRHFCKEKACFSVKQLDLMLNNQHPGEPIPLPSSVNKLQTYDEITAAIEKLSAYINLPSCMLHVKRKLVSYHLKLGHFHDALNILENPKIFTRTEDISYQLDKARCYLGMNDYKKAYALLKDLYQFGGNENSTCCLLYLICLNWLGYYSEAEKVYLACGTKGMGNTPGFILASLKFLKGQRKQDIVEKAFKILDQKEYVLYYARALRLFKKYDEAMVVYQTAIKEMKEEKSADLTQLNLLKIDLSHCYREIHQPQFALAELNTIQTNNEKEEKKISLAKIECHIELQESDVALNGIMELLKTYPEDYVLRRELAICLNKLSENTLALAEFEQVCQFSPDTLRYQLPYMAALAEEQKIVSSIEDKAAAIDIQFCSLEQKQSLLFAYAASREKDKANEILDSMEETNADNIYWKMFYYYKIGNINKALNLYDQYQKDFPELIIVAGMAKTRKGTKKQIQVMDGVDKLRQALQRFPYSYEAANALIKAFLNFSLVLSDEDKKLVNTLLQRFPYRKYLQLNGTELLVRASTPADPSISYEECVNRFKQDELAKLRLSTIFKKEYKESEEKVGSKIEEKVEEKAPEQVIAFHDIWKQNKNVIKVKPALAENILKPLQMYVESKADSKAHLQVYGGLLRDHLLGHQVFNDIDIATTLSVQEIRQILGKKFLIFAAPYSPVSDAQFLALTVIPEHYGLGRVDILCYQNVESFPKKFGSFQFNSLQGSVTPEGHICILDTPRMRENVETLLPPAQNSAPKSAQKTSDKSFSEDWMLWYEAISNLCRIPYASLDETCKKELEKATRDFMEKKELSPEEKIMKARLMKKIIDRLSRCDAESQRFFELMIEYKVIRLFGREAEEAYPPQSTAVRFVQYLLPSMRGKKPIHFNLLLSFAEYVINSDFYPVLARYGCLNKYGSMIGLEADFDFDSEITNLERLYYSFHNKLLIQQRQEDEKATSVNSSSTSFPSVDNLPKIILQRPKDMESKDDSHLITSLSEYIEGLIKELDEFSRSDIEKVTLKRLFGKLGYFDRKIGEMVNMPIFSTLSDHDRHTNNSPDPIFRTSSEMIERVFYFITVDFIRITSRIQRLSDASSAVLHKQQLLSFLHSFDKVWIKKLLVPCGRSVYYTMLEEIIKVILLSCEKPNNLQFSSFHHVLASGNQCAATHNLMGLIMLDSNIAFLRKMLKDFVKNEPLIKYIDELHYSLILSLSVAIKKAITDPVSAGLGAMSLEDFEKKSLINKVTEMLFSDDWIFALRRVLDKGNLLPTNIRYDRAKVTLVAFFHLIHRYAQPLILGNLIPNNNPNFNILKTAGDAEQLLYTIGRLNQLQENIFSVIFVFCGRPNINNIDKPDDVSLRLNTIIMNLSQLNQAYRIGRWGTIQQQQIDKIIYDFQIFSESFIPKMMEDHPELGMAWLNVDLKTLGLNELSKTPYFPLTPPPKWSGRHDLGSEFLIPESQHQQFLQNPNAFFASQYGNNPGPMIAAPSPCLAETKPDEPRRIFKYNPAKALPGCEPYPVNPTRKNKK